MKILQNAYIFFFCLISRALGTETQHLEGDQNPVVSFNHPHLPVEIIPWSMDIKEFLTFGGRQFNIETLNMFLISSSDLYIIMKELTEFGVRNEMAFKKYETDYYTKDTIVNQGRDDYHILLRDIKSKEFLKRVSDEYKASFRKLGQFWISHSNLIWGPNHIIVQDGSTEHLINSSHSIACCFITLFLSCWRREVGMENRFICTHLECRQNWQALVENKWKIDLMEMFGFSEIEIRLAMQIRFNEYQKGNIENIISSVLRYLKQIRNEALTGLVAVGTNLPADIITKDQLVEISKKLIDKNTIKLIAGLDCFDKPLYELTVYTQKHIHKIAELSRSRSNEARNAKQAQDHVLEMSDKNELALMIQTITNLHARMGHSLFRLVKNLFEEKNLSTKRSYISSMDEPNLFHIIFLPQLIGVIILEMYRDAWEEFFDIAWWKRDLNPEADMQKLFISDWIMLLAQCFIINGLELTLARELKEFHQESGKAIKERYFAEEYHEKPEFNEHETSSSEDMIVVC